MNDIDKTKEKLLKELDSARQGLEESRKALEELRESEKKYRKIFTSSPLGIFYFESNGIITECNENFLKILGSKRETVIGLNLPAVLKDPQMSAAVAACLSGRVGYYEGDYVSITSGMCVPIKATYGPILSENGALIGGMGVIEDITERRRAEAANIKSAARLAEAQRIARLGSWERDITNNAWTWSDEMFRIFGLSKEGFEGNLEAFLKRVHPDDREYIKRVLEDPLLTTGDSSKDYRIVRPDGAARIVSGWREVRLDEAGRPAHLAGTVQDITEQRHAEDALRESEKRFRQLSESIKEVFWLSDAKSGQMLYVSPAYEKIWGRTCESLYSSPWSWSSAIHPQDAGRVLNLTGEFEEVYRIIRPDGTARWVRDRNFPINDGSGNLYRFARVTEDITESKKMEDELLKTQKLESVGVLAGGIAHDFNNLLTGITGYVYCAKEISRHDDKIYNILNNIEKVSLRAVGLTKQLLTFARGGKPIKSAVDIAELIKESADLVLSGSNVKCALSIAGDLRAVEADEGQINQVLSNLMINAVQAMPDGGTIAVRGENVDIGASDTLPLKAGKYAKISIEDSGAGISEESLQKIFDPYFTTKQKGSGLGLASSYSIVKKHNGLIDVESKVGAGSVFRVYLPAADKDAPAKRDSDKGIIGGHGRILVMDDEEMIRDVAVGILTQLGYTVDFSKDGAEAITLYKKAKVAGKPYDLLIMDLTVPSGMGGKDAVRQILEMDPGAKAIVSSGYSADPIMSEFRKYGFRAVIAKPYKITDLSRIIDQVIRENNPPPRAL